GASSKSDIGFGGSVAINVASVNTSALIDGGAAVNANGANVGLTAQATAANTAKALATKDATGKSVGIGASFALNVGNDTTSAALQETAGLTGAHDLTLSATGADTMTTEAQNGADGGTAISPTVALAFDNETTTALVGTGALLSLGG